jgi:hypothetical protein
MCSRAIRIWICAYRVLCAAVDEVELDEDQALRKVRSIFECVVAALRFSGASVAAQSTPVTTTNAVQHPFQHGHREGGEQKSSKDFGVDLSGMEDVAAHFGGILPGTWL